MRLRILPQAERDLDRLAAHIATDHVDVALRLYDSAERAFAHLLRFPQLGAPRGDLVPSVPSLRVWTLPAFPNVLIFYESAGDEVRIVRILHGARDVPSIPFG